MCFPISLSIAIRATLVLPAPCVHNKQAHKEKTHLGKTAGNTFGFNKVCSPLVRTLAGSHLSPWWSWTACSECDSGFWSLQIQPGHTWATSQWQQAPDDTKRVLSARPEHISMLLITDYFFHDDTQPTNLIIRKRFRFEGRHVDFFISFALFTKRAVWQLTALVGHEMAPLTESQVIKVQHLSRGHWLMDRKDENLSAHKYTFQISYAVQNCLKYNWEAV